MRENRRIRQTRGSGWLLEAVNKTLRCLVPFGSAWWGEEKQYKPLHKKTPERTLENSLTKLKKRELYVSPLTRN